MAPKRQGTKIRERLSTISGVTRVGHVHSEDSPLLLVADSGNHVVRIMDALTGTHEGDLAPVGVLNYPRMIAASASVIAVSTWGDRTTEDHAIHIFNARGARERTRVLSSSLCCPFGVRIARFGRSVVVANFGNGTVVELCTTTGNVLQTVASELRAPYDVERCDGGWLVACGESHTVVLTEKDPEDREAGEGLRGHSTLHVSNPCGHPTSVLGLLLLPKHGLLTRQYGDRVQQYAP